MSSSERDELPLLRRLAEATVLAGFLTGAYMGAGRWTPPAAEPLVHVIDTLVPFVPETVWLYLPGYWGCFLVTIWAVRDARQFRAAMTGLAALTVLAVPFFLEWPVAAPRTSAPPGDGLTEAMVRWLYANDPAGNTFPSLHVANATLCAVITTASNRRWGVVAWLLTAGVAVSVLTLKQHWAVDVPGGLALATVGAAAWRAHLAAPALRQGAFNRRGVGPHAVPEHVAERRRAGRR